MTSAYNYSLSADFPFGIDISLLEIQIRDDPLITTLLTSIYVDELIDLVEITFLGSLTPTEHTQLDTIVLNHRPGIIDDPIVMTTNSPDTEAIQLIASGTTGGIIIHSGLGGVTVRTTGGFSVESADNSNISVINGNLTLESTNDVLNIEGSSGINIGNDISGSPINIGTTSERSINIGNVAGSTSISLAAGDGIGIESLGSPISIKSTNSSSDIGIITNANNQDLSITLAGSTNSKISIMSEGTGASAIQLASIGGITVNSGSHPIVLSSSVTSGTAISINALSTASVGIANSTGGDVFVSTATGSRDTVIGTNNVGSILYTRSAGSIIKSQSATHTLADASNILTVANVLTGILIGNPTLGRSVTIPSITDFRTALPKLIIGDSIEFSIINTSSLIATISITNSVIGNSVVGAGMSARFLIRFSGASNPPTAYNIYRIT